MTQKLDHDVQVTLAIDENLLKEHFEKFEEDLTLLPEENRTLCNADGTPAAGNRVTVTIPANQTSAIGESRTIPFSIKLNVENLSFNKMEY